MKPRWATGTIKAIQAGTLVLVLVACVRSRSVEMDTELDPSELKPRDSVDLAMLSPEQRAEILARLARDSIVLERTGFNQRLENVPGGYFVTPDEIEELAPRTLSDVFRHVPAMVGAPFAMTGRPAGSQHGCFIPYVNGLLNKRALSDLSNFIQPREVVAAEVYPPDQPPPSPFTASSRPGCTTVVLWTRSAND